MITTLLALDRSIVDIVTRHQRKMAKKLNTKLDEAFDACYSLRSAVNELPDSVQFKIYDRVVGKIRSIEEMNEDYLLVALVQQIELEILSAKEEVKP